MRRAFVFVVCVPHSVKSGGGSLRECDTERYACGMQDVFLWEIVGDFEILCFLKTSQNLSKNPKNSHNTQLHPPVLRAAFRNHPYHSVKKRLVQSAEVLFV